MTQGRQFVQFSFFRVSKTWYNLSPQKREKLKSEYYLEYQTVHRDIITNAYSLFGLRKDSEFMLWRISDTLEALEQSNIRLSKTRFGQFMRLSHCFLSVSKRSTYIDPLDAEHTESRTVIRPGKFKYIFVYPFIKTRDWYLLPHEDRQKMMNEHIIVGNKYPSIKLNTTYSFGIDDQDFVVAFETDHPNDFLDLVMQLRETEASEYTQQDTPMFTAIHRSIQSILDIY